MQQNYLKGKSLWACKVPTDCSWAVRKLLQLCDQYRDAYHTVIGDGRETSLFYDCWMGECRIMEMDGISSQELGYMQNAKVSDWWVQGTWRIPNSFTRRWPAIVEQIKQHTLRNDHDKVVWKHCNSGRFSIASAYDFLRHRENTVEWANCIWQTRGIPQHQFILWLVFRNSLKTREVLID